MHDILKEDAEPVLMELLKGISVDVKLNLWKQMSDVLKKVGDGLPEMLQEIIPPMYMEIVGSLLMLTVQSNLNIKIDENMKKKISENPLVEPVLLSAPMLLGALVGDFESDEEFFKQLSEAIPPPFNELIVLFAKHIGNEITFEVCDHYVGIKGRVGGEGLDKLIQTVDKFALKKMH